MSVLPTVQKKNQPNTKASKAKQLDFASYDKLFQLSF
jgi:hypothetical protein